MTTNLRAAKLRNSKFIDADMRDTDMSDADLTNSDFSGANLQGVMGLTQKQLNTACGSKETKLSGGLSIVDCSEQQRKQAGPRRTYVSYYRMGFIDGIIFSLWAKKPLSTRFRRGDWLKKWKELNSS